MSKTRILQIMIVLCAMGALLSMYLLYTTITQNFGICPTNGCETIGSSEYAYFIGLPVAFWGLGYYCVMFLLSTLMLSRDDLYEKLLKYFGILLLIGVVFTLYLRYIEFFVVEAVCFWCWGSVLTVLGLAATYIGLRKKN